MLPFCRSSIAIALLAAAGVLLHDARGWAQPFGAFATGRSFELSDTVQLDRVDQTVLAQLERVKACLADRQWDEAVDALRRLAESSETKLLGVTERRYVNLRDYVQMQLAALPPEALARYRSRVDPKAQEWYETGVAQRQSNLLWNVVDQAFASSYSDKALLALGEMALESGDAASARWCWQRILPNRPAAGAPPTWPSYPDTKVDVAAVRARLVLASILEGSPARARAELTSFAAIHGEARGRLGGREAKYVEALGALLAASAAWPQRPPHADWPTFAGSPQRNRVAPPLIDVGAVAWRTPLRPKPPSATRAFEPTTSGEDPRKPLSFQPLLVGTMVLVNDPHAIKAFDLERGDSDVGERGNNLSEPTHGRGGRRGGAAGNAGHFAFHHDGFRRQALCSHGFCRHQRAAGRRCGRATRLRGLPGPQRPRAFVVAGRAGRRLGVRGLAASRRRGRVHRHAPQRHPPAGVCRLSGRGERPASLASLPLRGGNARPRRILRKHAQSVDVGRQHAVLQYQSRGGRRRAHRRRPAALGQSLSSRAARRPDEAGFALAARLEPLRFTIMARCWRRRPTARASSPSMPLPAKCYGKRKCRWPTPCASWARRATG